MSANYDSAVNYIRSKMKCSPEIGIILGSGLGGIAESIKDGALNSFNGVKEENAIVLISEFRTSPKDMEPNEIIGALDEYTWSLAKNEENGEWDAKGWGYC